MCHRNLCLLSLLMIIAMYFGIHYWKHQAEDMKNKYHHLNEFIINNTSH